MRFALIWILPKALLFLQNTEIKGKQKPPLQIFKNAATRNISEQCNPIPGKSLEFTLFLPCA